MQQAQNSKGSSGILWLVVFVLMGALLSPLPARADSTYFLLDQDIEGEKRPWVELGYSHDVGDFTMSFVRGESGEMVTDFLDPNGWYSLGIGTSWNVGDGLCFKPTARIAISNSELTWSRFEFGGSYRDLRWRAFVRQYQHGQLQFLVNPHLPLTDIGNCCTLGIETEVNIKEGGHYDVWLGPYFEFPVLDDAVGHIWISNGTFRLSTFLLLD